MVDLRRDLFGITTFKFKGFRNADIRKQDDKMNLKMKRLLFKLSQTELAEKVGITNVTLSHIEQGRTLPNPNTKAKITKILGKVDWPEDRIPLTTPDMERLFFAIEVAAARIGLHDALRLFLTVGFSGQKQFVQTLIDSYDAETLPPMEDKKHAKANSKCKSDESMAHGKRICNGSCHSH